jgi:hypothetical protein
MKNKIITLLSLLLLSGISSNAQTLDQALNTTPTSCLTTSSSNHQGQSFTCGLSGNLSRIKVNITSITSFGNVTIKVYNGDGTGGALLHSSSQAITNTGIQSFNIGPSIPVTAGSMYTFELEPTTANVCSAIFTGNAYANGKRYLNGVSSSIIDMWFETYVTAAGTNLTQLNATQCDQTLYGLGGSFYCNKVTNAQDYQFRVSGGNLTNPVAVRRNGPWANILRTSVTGIAEGFTYNVEVRARVSNVWQPYSSICQVTIASTTCQLIPTDCNQQESATGYLYCTNVDGATNYKFRITGGDIPTFVEIERTGPYKNFNKASVPMNVGQVYFVEVTAKVNGSYMAYGTQCLVEVTSLMDSPEDLMRFAETEAEEALIVEENNFNLTVYPNPSGSNGFEVQLNGFTKSENDVVIEVYDIYGKLILSENHSGKTNGVLGRYNLDQSIASGIYILKATANGKSITEKIVVE